jgi:hypothetical protein
MQFEGWAYPERGVLRACIGAFMRGTQRIGFA